MFRLTLELFTQFRILGSNSYRTSIKVTFAHHNAADCNQRHRRETVLFCSEQSSNCNVTTCFKLTVGLQSHPSTQMVQHQSLMRF